MLRRMRTQFTPRPGLALAITAAGSFAELARRIDLSVSTVHSWVRRDQELPAEHVLPVESATGVSRHDLRPDLYPREESASAPSATGTLFPLEELQA